MSGLSAKRRHNFGYGRALQRRCGSESALSCFDISDLGHYVVKVNGEAVTPFWADTLPVPPKGSITVRMRFTEFTGKYVWHCHALDHEDLGMMQLVEVV